MKMFVNPYGILCIEFKFYSISLTSINVYPVFDGVDVNGKIINEK